jgi:hypothetical protein
MSDDVPPRQIVGVQRCVEEELAGFPATDLGATLTLRALRLTTQLLPEIPAPPHIQRA